MFRKLACVLLATIPLATSALAQGQSSSSQGAPTFRKASVYNSFGRNSAFIRGGYAFADTEDFTDYSAPNIAVGGSYFLSASGKSRFFVEGEIYVSRQSESVSGVGISADATQWILAPNVAGRWQYQANGTVAPFISAGIGPGLVITSVDLNGLSDSTTDFVFAYTSRAGLHLTLSDKIDLEAAYRYLGLTQDGSIGIHGAEAGLNVKF
ncbi:MAG: outer membrane beta-barrel protein [Pseudomonadota bacterium]